MNKFHDIYSHNKAKKRTVNLKCKRCAILFQQSAGDKNTINKDFYKNGFKNPIMLDSIFIKIPNGIKFPEQNLKRAINRVYGQLIKRWKCLS